MEANTLIQFSHALADVVEQASRSIVTVKEGGQHGVSGTVWRPGVVVTAEHTIRGRQEVTLALPSGATTNASVAGRDPGTDIAVLKVDETKTPAADVVEAKQVRVGHVVLAVGRRADDGLSASFGVVGAIGGPWRTWQGGRVDSYFRLDLLPFPGFSGGALVDVEGRVIGVNTSGPRRSVLTIPATTVSRVVTQLLEKGRITRGYIGAGLQPVRLQGAPTAARKQATGLLVITLTPEGPAEKAGLLIGDIVLGAGNQELADTADLQAALDPEQVGKALRLQVLRGGRLAEVEIIIGERPGRP